MSQRLQVAFLSAELDPLAKVGGLADVAQALPKALASLKINICRFLPFYGTIKNKDDFKLLFSDLSVGEEKFSLYLWKKDKKVPTYLISASYFSGGYVYAPNNSNPERYRFFSKACLVALEKINFKPDIIHGNDWHCGLLPRQIKDYPGSFFSSTRTLLTIHNLAVQGLEESSGQNFLLTGILDYDFLNTVSPTYAQEILTPEYSCGLQQVLSSRQDSLVGILNGIDNSLYNPQKDRHLFYRHHCSLEKFKKINKEALQKELALPILPEAPVFSFISRLTSQKGLELFSLEALEKIIQAGGQLIFLGSGEEYYEKMLLAWKEKYPQNVKVVIGYDAVLAQRIYAGSTFFFVPSAFEPCGLTQMISMRYGTLPIVRLTGGLKDTVEKNCGFVFKEFSSEALAESITLALNIYLKKPRVLRKMRRKAWKKDFSVDRFAFEYKKLYYLLYEKEK